MLENPLQLLLFVLPAYFANSTPVLFGGGAPVDLGRNAWDGRRIFGDGKTWKGLLAGMVCGSLVGIAEALLLNDSRYYLLGFLLSLGAMAGDLFGSFLKRRMGLERGHPLFVVDQLPFLLFALAFASPVYLPSPEGILLLAVLTYLLHVATNFAANRLGLKKVPW